MSPAEKETTINWSEADQEVSIFTSSKSVATYCIKQKLELRDERKNQKGRTIGWEFFIPAKDFCFGKKKKMNLSPEQKQKLAERLKKARKK